MLGLWKSKKVKDAEEAKRQSEHETQLETFVKDDVLGADEWRESKLGYLTGLSSVGKVVGSVTTNVAQSFGRVGWLWSYLSKTDNLPSLPDVDKTSYDGRQRFKEAQRLHRRSEAEIKRAITNTWRSSLLYGGISIFATLYFIGSLLVREHMYLTTLVLHLAGIIIFSALTFRSAYYNWMFRNRTLDLPPVFLRSGDCMPKG